jgi:quinol-cytochrome oxidoreductase complex cytochrome b subunit
MEKWASVAGLLLTAIGVLVAFYLPRLHAYFGSSPASVRKEYWRRVRTGMGAALVILGTILQIYAAWPV